MPRKAGSLLPRTRRLLDAAMEHVKSVDYGVPLRWIFYRMIQYYGLTKNDYNSFKTTIIRARKKRHRGWAPYTLTDETRAIYKFSDGYDSVTDWINRLRYHGVKCNLNKHQGQKYLVQVWFEAQAMYEQFAKYTAPYYVTLVPFRGDVSLPIKWKLAQEIREALINGVPVKILYFGDLDQKGMTIPTSAVTDIREWASKPEPESEYVAPDFDFIRVGLNPEHVNKYELPENPERPGQYQWEALDDSAAAEMITTALDQYIDLDQIQSILESEKRIEAVLLEYLREWDPPMEARAR